MEYVNTLRDVTLGQLFDRLVGAGVTVLEIGIPFVVALTILVFVHEYGHYWVARRCGVRVMSFSVGWGNEIIGFNDKAGTRWKFSQIPIGGFVSLFGESDRIALPAPQPSQPIGREVPDNAVFFVDEERARQARSSVPAAGATAEAVPLWKVIADAATGFAAFLVAVVRAAVSAASWTVATAAKTPQAIDWIGRNGLRAAVTESGQAMARWLVPEDPTPRRDMTPEERAVAFYHKGVGQRAAIIVAGPAANYIFAILVLAGLYMSAGQAFTNATLVAVPEQGASHGILRPGDTIVSLDGTPIGRFEDIQQFMVLNRGDAVQVGLMRDGQLIEARVKPRPTEANSELFLLGIQAGKGFRTLDPLSAFAAAVSDTAAVSINTLVYLGQTLSGARSGKELGGPISIAAMTSQTAKVGVYDYVYILALLSISLGLINLFPIPVLDGGHLLFYGVEATTGRRVPEPLQVAGTLIGIVLVLSLMVFATWNDLVRFKVFEFLSGLLP